MGLGNSKGASARIHSQRSRWLRLPGHPLRRGNRGMLAQYKVNRSSSMGCSRHAAIELVGITILASHFHPIHLHRLRGTPSPIIQGLTLLSPHFFLSNRMLILSRTFEIG